jgi:hypothetical protein
MKIKFWIAYMAVFYTMFLSQVSANQMRPENTNPMRIMLAMDTLFKPAPKSEGLLVIETSELEMLRKLIQDQFDFLEAEVNRTSMLGKDSIQQVPRTLEENTEAIEEITPVQNQEAGFNQHYLLLIGFFLITCLILGFLYFSNLKKVNESQTRLTELENEFSDYKSTMIDRAISQFISK